MVHASWPNSDGREVKAFGIDLLRASLFSGWRHYKEHGDSRETRVQQRSRQKRRSQGSRG
ncbi:hypothetical protein E2562_038787 [Oryza meyeriana var. granulata]|uniref:Uncharacterized protein n=1 Tax=Oryza meyeriana var. granulata TaxID=110450 RepID=A0A6G1C361_9ORYZ|nr:hypothetical protein E2562_038787 [Oryza meyeriana var. granulata]